MTRTKAAMFFRGMSKVMFIAIAVNLFLTNIFEYLAQTLDLGLDNQAVTLFSCVTCGLLTLWLSPMRAVHLHSRRPTVMSARKARAAMACRLPLIVPNAGSSSCTSN